MTPTSRHCARSLGLIDADMPRAIDLGGISTIVIHNDNRYGDHDAVVVGVEPVAEDADAVSQVDLLLRDGGRDGVERELDRHDRHAEREVDADLVGVVRHRSHALSIDDRVVATVDREHHLGQRPVVQKIRGLVRVLRGKGVSPSLEKQLGIEDEGDSPGRTVLTAVHDAP